VFLSGRDLDPLGRLVDFGEVKRHAQRWIEKNWDHAFLLSDQDEELVSSLRSVPEAKLYLFSGENPSAEAMARCLFEQTRQRFGVLARRVRVWESTTQYAEYWEEAPE
jgi:6-pyruvoyl-tetrahydropterin synthase